MNIVPFEFNTHEVRSVIGDDGEPLFVAKDICDCLGLENITWALDGIDDEDLSLVKLKSGGQFREMKLLNESGLYQLIFKSKKEEARAFTRWVTKEVLPAIRKTGRYSVGGGVDAMAFYNDYKSLNPQHAMTLCFEGASATAYTDAKHGFLISGVELSKLIGKSPESLRCMKLYHKDIIVAGEAFVSLGQKTYYTQKGAMLMALHSHNKAYAEHLLAQRNMPYLTSVEE